MVGKKYLKYTNQYRQLLYSQRIKKMKQIINIPKSGIPFQKTFPQYPIQYTWKFNNIDLHAYAWEPNKQQYSKPKALVVNYNALNFHTGLTGKMAQTLANSGILMTGVDYPNFGKSASPFPGHIGSMDQIETISQQFLMHAIQKYPGIPVYLNGMSMGGLMAFQVAWRKPTLVYGCILLNPAFRDNPVDNGFLKKLVMVGGFILPKLKIFKTFRNNSSYHSLRKYKLVDQLIYHGKLWTSTIWNLLYYMRKVSKKEHFSQFYTNFLYIQGGSDKLLDPFTAFQLQKYSRSIAKQIVIIPNLWHALWFDDHHDEVVQMVKQWILNLVQSSTPNSSQQPPEATPKQNKQKINEDKSGLQNNPTPNK